MTHNRISEINLIFCLSSLDMLGLSYNLISAIDNTAFYGLTQLRIINISHNNLKTIDNWWFVTSEGGLFFYLAEIDVSHLAPSHFFCKFDFSSNKLDRLVSKENFDIDLYKKYYGGFVSLEHNTLTECFNFYELGLANTVEVGKLFSFGM